MHCAHIARHAQHSCTYWFHGPRSNYAVLPPISAGMAPYVRQVMEEVSRVPAHAAPFCLSTKSVFRSRTRSNALRSCERQSAPRLRVKRRRSGGG
jgi:hypothetical protein